jgi:hypothetical protein
VPPDVRQSIDEVSGDRSRQYEAVGESNSWDLEVPIPSSKLGRSWRGLHSDEEALKLIEDSTVTVGQDVDMLGVDMSQG